MKKLHLKKIALMGVASAVVAAQLHAGTESNNGFNGKRYYITDAVDTSTQNLSTKPLTESELLSKLSPEGKATYQSLDKEGKDLALKLANQSCKGQNSCKGMNSCKTQDNSCAGQGGCKGTSPGPFMDKNEAVKVAAKQMAQKRSAINGGNR